MRLFYVLLLCLFAGTASAQSYTSFFTGDTTDATTSPLPGGICLMGGATENDSASAWFLRRANGGDVVVLRTSGGNGYNSYFYSGLGVSVNSVQTILFNSPSAAQDQYVRQQLRNAEAVFIAGGDQWTYIQQWRGTPIDSILNWSVNTRHMPIGGTSAGMMILGESYFSAQVSSVTSAAALANPFDAGVTLGRNDFLHLPFLKNTITDTHYDNPDRRGRQMVFLARMMRGNGDTARGIACDEFTAVCVDSSGLARVFGDASVADNAYFLQVNCATPNMPEVLTANTPIAWVRTNDAVKVYHTKGDSAGTQTFNLKYWRTGSGGIWERWWIDNGIFVTDTSSAPNCSPTAVREIASAAGISLYPNPGKEVLYLQSDLSQTARFAVYNAIGVKVQEGTLLPGENSIATAAWPVGMYAIVWSLPGSAVQTLRWVKQ